jgi:beta-galactosidase GanA
MGQMKKFKKLYTEVASVVQRKKLQRRMAKMAKSPVVQMKKKRAALKMRNPAKLAQLARKKTIQSFRDKFYPGYKDMSLQQKVKIDQVIMQKYGKKIDKISKKVVKKLQKLETERVKKAKETQKNA